ncbi:unnamed protein product [Calypogeia fissa]
MSEDLPVQGTILSSPPCTVKDAAALLGKFLQSESVPESGLLRGYLESVTSCLEELASRQDPKPKEKKSKKHREVDHQTTEVQEHATTSGLNAAAVTSEAEQENGYKKTSGKKRKGHEEGGEENEEYVKKKKLSYRKDVGGGVGNVETSVKKKSHQKRKDAGVDVEDNVLSVKKQLHFESDVGGVHLENNVPGEISLNCFSLGD